MRPTSKAAIAIDLASDLPIYQQIADEIVRLIGVGDLALGDPLPSMRELGAGIGVNLNTVARAYRQLAEAGVIDMRHGAIATVAAPPAKEIDEFETKKLDDLIGRWALHGADRRTIEAHFGAALDRRFKRRR